MKSSEKIFIASVILSLIFLIAIVYIVKKNEPEKVIKLPISIREYSEFECPACKKFSGVGTQIEEKFKEDVDYKFTHFPLESIHPDSYNAAVASEAARKQDKFQSYHDKLFENQDNLKEEDFYKYAEELELNLEKFKDDYQNNEEIKSQIDQDIKSGEEKGVNGVPSFFLNGEKYDFSNDLTLQENILELLNEIENLIMKAKAQKQE